MKNGTIRWAPNKALRDTCLRGDVHLPAVLTDGYAGTDELGPYVEFRQIRVTLKGRPDLQELWEEAMSTGHPVSDGSVEMKNDTIRWVPNEIYRAKARRRWVWARSRGLFVMTRGAESWLVIGIMAVVWFLRVGDHPWITRQCIDFKPCLNFMNPLLARFAPLFQGISDTQTALGHWAVAAKLILENIGQKLKGAL
jgi:hypothetical protein